MYFKTGFYCQVTFPVYNCLFAIYEPFSNFYGGQKGEQKRLANSGLTARSAHLEGPAVDLGLGGRGVTLRRCDLPGFYAAAFALVTERYKAITKLTNSQLVYVAVCGAAFEFHPTLKPARD